MLASDLKALQETYQDIYEESDGISCEMLEEIVEELVEEFVEFGYTIDEAASAVEEAAILYIDEAKVTYGSDTESPEQRRERAKAKVGEKRAAARKTAVKSAVGRVKAKAAGAAAGASIAGSIAKDTARRAARTAVHKVTYGAQKKKQEVKSGVKSLVGRGLRKAAGAVGKVAQKAAGAASRLGEEVVDEQNAGPSTPVKFDSHMGQLVPNQGAGRVGAVRLKPGMGLKKGGTVKEGLLDIGRSAAQTAGGVIGANRGRQTGIPGAGKVGEVLGRERGGQMYDKATEPLKKLPIPGLKKGGTVKKEQVSFEIGSGDPNAARRQQKINKAADAGVPNAAAKAKGPLLPSSMVKLANSYDPEDIYDLVIEHLLQTQQAETITEAQYVMSQMTIEHIRSIAEAQGEWFRGALNPNNSAASRAQNTSPFNKPTKPLPSIPSPFAKPASRDDSGKLTTYGAGGGAEAERRGQTRDQVMRQGAKNLENKKSKPVNQGPDFGR